MRLIRVVLEFWVELSILFPHPSPFLLLKILQKKKKWKASRDKLLCWCCYGDSNGFYDKGLLPLGKSGLSAMPILGDV